MLRAASIALLASLAACANDTSEVREELARLRHELYDIKSDLRHTREDYTDLKRQVELLRAQGGTGPAQGAPRAAVPVAPKDLAPPPLPIVRLAPDGGQEVMEDEIGAVDDGSPPILIKMGPDADADNVGVDKSVLSKPDPVLSQSVPSPQEVYEGALAVLREEHDPGRAKGLLAAFERDHPDSSLADNAAYWTGEAEFMLAEFEAAAATFARVLQSYPQSGKKPWALLRLGESLHELGRSSDAVARLQQVVRQFPQSPAARTAKQRLAVWSHDEKGKM